MDDNSERPRGALGRGALTLYLTGFAVFIGLYIPQPLLPLFAADFGVEAQVAALLISATILGIALSSPLIGMLSDRFGRRSLLVGGSLLLGLATLGCAVAPTFGWLLAARFAQGLLLPTLMAVGVAYVSETMSGRQMRNAAGAYVACTVLGGMLGRVLAGAVADAASWRWTFLLSSLLFLGLVAAWSRQPELVSSGPRRRLGEVLRGTVGHFTNRTLLGGLLVGFFLFFAFQSTFSYLPFHLERPPFSLSSTLIGVSYLTYAVGMISSVLAGWYSARTGLRAAVLTGFGLTVLGNLAALSPSLALLLVGLVVLCLGNFLVQGLAVGYVATAVENDRAGANALYLLLYYLGGSLGAYLPGFLFTDWGYSGVVAASLVSLLLGALAAALLMGAPAHTGRGRSDAPA